MKSGFSSRLWSGISLTWILIIVNVIAFFLFLLISLSSKFSSYLVLTPSLFLYGKPIAYFWTLLTSMFLHAGLLHLFVNMFSLFYLGHLVERIIGKKRFFWLYFIAGMVGGLLFIVGTYFGNFIPRGDFLFGTPSTSAVGASGAIFGLVGLLSVLIPFKQVYFILGPLLVIIFQVIMDRFLPVQLQSVFSLLMSALILLMVFSIFSRSQRFMKFSLPVKLSFWAVPIVAIIPLFIISFFIDLPIGNTAHLGGLIVGLIYGFYLRSKYAKKVVLLNRIIK